MSIDYDYVQTLFQYLSTGKSENFFAHVADDVDWTVMGTHPLAGHYTSKEDFLNHTFRRLNKVLQAGVILKVKHIYICHDTAIVEMESLSTANNGKPFDNKYCWVVRFHERKIVEVRAYLDSWLVKNLLDENEPNRD